MTEFSKLLGFKVSFCSSRSPASNGKSEAFVKKVKNAIKYHTDSDTDIETVLPSVLLGLRTTRMKNSETSPFRLVYGFEPTLPLLGSAPDDPMSAQSTLISKHKIFLDNLTTNLRTLRDRVKDNIVAHKAEMKTAYDKAHKVATAHYKEGSKVWLHTPQIKAGSKSVISSKPYIGPYYISQVMHPPSGEGGVTYMLIHCATGRPHKAPVPHIRLKPAHDREELIDRFNPEAAKPVTITATTPTNQRVEQKSSLPVQPSQDKTELPEGYCPALRILRQRKISNGQIQYLILFTNKETFWCNANDCTEPLIRMWRLKQAKLRNRRRKQTQKKT